MNRLVLGFLCGVLAIGVRRVPGETLLELPRAGDGATLAARAAILGLVALALALSKRTWSGRPGTPLLFGAALGVWVEGLPVDLRFNGTSAMVPLALVALALFVLRDRRAEAEPAPETNPPGFAPAALLIGAGVTLLLDPLVRVVLRFGAGTGMEAAFVGGLFLLLATFGGLAFGAPLRAARDRAGSLAMVVAGLLTAPAALLSWGALRGQAIPPLARREFLDRFDLDRSLEGQLSVLGVVAVLGLLLPAFTAGLSVTCARRRGEASSLAGGAAIACALLALRWVEQPWFVGALVLAAAAPCALVNARAALKGRSRVALGVLGLIAVLTALPLRHMHTLDRSPVLPWERFPSPPGHLEVNRDGQFLVRRARGGIAQVLLDRVEIAPSHERAAADAKRLELALGLVPAAARADGFEVLLVGQLTPGRAFLMNTSGVTRVDRTAAWWRTMDDLETRLFQGQTEITPPVGEVVAPGVAEKRLAAGAYDLVVVPAVKGGPPPRAPRLPEVEGTIVVAWIDASLDLAQRRLPEYVLVTLDGMHEPALALVSGLELDEQPAAPDMPAFWRSGAPIDAPGVREYGFERGEDRDRRARSALMRRFAQAYDNSPWEELTAGLAAHFEAQVRSSPWADRAVGSELVEPALTHLLAAGARAQPDRLTREVWDGLADILIGKRDVEGIWRWVEPLAGFWDDWKMGEIALALADLESLDVEAAAARLAPIETTPADLELYDHHRRARLKLAAALRDAGDAQGAQDLVEELLREDPENRRAWGLLAPVPPEEPEEHLAPPEDGQDDG
ncbi:MAG: tetratricopeptide repeat protein [Planctomycetota bacterium]|nr:tetratricopeptide repeat protein [Planctomycetota bacterium]